MTAPVLTSERLILRRHEEADLDAAAQMWSDPAVVRYIGGRPFTREEVWHRILRYVGHWSLRPFGYWAIQHRYDMRFLGEIGLADWRRGSIALDLPEAGWALASAEHGAGYASEAIGLMLDWADATGVGATCCIINEENAASIRLAERFGYVRAFRADATVPVFERSAAA